MAVVLTNNATSLLAAAIDAADTTLSVENADAGKFPTPTVGEWFPLTIVDNAGNMEILRATTRAGSIITVERAQEGTTAKAFAAGARVDLRATAAALNDVGEKATTKTVGAAMAGANGKEAPADSDFFTGVEAGGSTMFKTTWANLKGAVLAYLQPLFDNRYFKIVGGVVTGDVQIQKNLPGLVLSSPSYANVYRIFANVSDTVDGGILVRRIGGDTNIADIGVGGFAFDGYGNLRARAGSVVYSGSASFHNDGNLYGTLWGGYLADNLNSRFNARVSDTRFAGYVDAAIYLPDSTVANFMPSGYVVTGVWKSLGNYLSFAARQPQIFINGAWRPLGAW